MIIDIGAEAKDRGSSATEGYTRLAVDNPANADGKIDTIEVWFYLDCASVKVGTFYLVNGTNYKCRDSITINNIISGAKRTFTGLSLTVKAGDYIGCWLVVAGEIERDTSGYGGIYYVAGEYIDPGDQATYTLLAGQAMSLYGTGTTPAVLGSKSANMAAKLVAAGVI